MLSPACAWKVGGKGGRQVTYPPAHISVSHRSPLGLTTGETLGTRLVPCRFGIFPWQGACADLVGLPCIEENLLLPCTEIKRTK